VANHHAYHVQNPGFNPHHHNLKIIQKTEEGEGREEGRRGRGRGGGGSWAPVAHNCNTWQTEMWRTEIRGHPRQIVLENPSPKITRAKWTGGVAQEVECLLCKEETLSHKKPRKTLENIYQNQPSG
jgi:hypothetical protein